MNASDGRILIAGIGNIFFGDDAFGVEVARRLMQRDWPAGVSVRDFGIRGFDLAYALMEPNETAILIDAVPRGGPPGTLCLLELSSADVGPADGRQLDAHTMDPQTVLRMVRDLGGSPGRILLVGCEPTPLPDEEDMQMALSEPVLLAVDEAIRLIESLVNDIQEGQDAHWTAPATAGAADRC